MHPAKLTGTSIDRQPADISGERGSYAYGLRYRIRRSGRSRDRRPRRLTRGIARRSRRAARLRNAVPADRAHQLPIGHTGANARAVRWVTTARSATRAAPRLAALASDRRHVHAVPTHGDPPLLPGGPRLIRTPLVGSALRVRRAPAFARDLSLARPIHRGEAATALPSRRVLRRRLRPVVLCMSSHDERPPFSVQELDRQSAQISAGQSRL